MKDLNFWATPIIVLILIISLIVMLIKVIKSKDGGKGVIKSLQINKIGISEVTLFALGFMEAVVAGESHVGTSSQYAIRMGVHILIAWIGAFAGSFAFREVADAYYKTRYEEHTQGYLFVQWFQALFALMLGLLVPFFNLIIIAKGIDQLHILRGNIPTDLVNANGSPVIYEAGYIERFDYSEGVTLISSTVMILLHILLTVGIALWSIDDIVKPSSEEKEVKGKSEEKAKEPANEEVKKRPKDKTNHNKDKEVAEPNWSEAATFMANSLGINVISVNNALGNIEDETKRKELKRKLIDYGWWYAKNTVKLKKARAELEVAKQVQDVTKIEGVEKELLTLKNSVKQTSQNFESLWEAIQHGSN